MRCHGLSLRTGRGRFFFPAMVFFDMTIAMFSPSRIQVCLGYNIVMLLDSHYIRFGSTHR